MTTTGRACQHLKRDGGQCQAAAQAESDYCFWHDPARAAERAAARKAGGKARHGRQIGATGPVKATPAIRLETVEDVRALLEQTANDLLTLENSINRARTIVALAGVALKALEVGEIEARLAAIEAQMRGGDDGKAA